MTKSGKTNPRTSLITLIVVFTFVLAALVPFAVLAAQDNNIFVLAITIPAMLVLLVLDGVSIGLLLKARGDK